MMMMIVTLTVIVVADLVHRKNIEIAKIEEKKIVNRKNLKNLNRKPKLMKLPK
ncbi:hypothetical protein BLA29_008755 [Euroglyphus maynei]|uniref:Uncharacterized protein n=1 Tax=Euroglyphus maynei TaxID=6958 RepID=A0A1Y3BL47_EURMA|nr:hypothetical protein BLA29_008755 [Euroglyphus maynei]